MMNKKYTLLSNDEDNDYAVRFKQSFFEAPLYESTESLKPHSSKSDEQLEDDEETSVKLKSETNADVKSRSSRQKRIESIENKKDLTANIKEDIRKEFAKQVVNCDSDSIQTKLVAADNKDKYLEMSSKQVRKRNKSGSEETLKASTTFRKENIIVNLEEGDSLQSVALRYNCTMSELKTANRIYNDQDFHALKKIQVPVHSFSELVDLAAESNDSAETSLVHEKISKSVKQMNIELELQDSYKQKLKVLKHHEIQHQLKVMSDDDDDEKGMTTSTSSMATQNIWCIDDEYTDYDDEYLEKDRLLSPPHRGGMFRGATAELPKDASGVTAEKLLNDIEGRIKVVEEDVKNKRETRDDAIDSLSSVHVSVTDSSASTAASPRTESLGLVCGISWRAWICAGITLVAGIPLILYLVAHLFPDSFKDFHYRL